MRRPNGYYKSAAPVQLFLLSRVIEAEGTSAFAQAKIKADLRSQSSLKAVETRRAKLMKQVEKMQVSVKRSSPEHIQKAALASYNSRNLFNFADKNAKPEFLTRLCVNYIRHECTKYDSSIEDVAGKTGVNEAIRQIRVKIYTAIAQAYPEFKDECDRQLKARLEMMSGG